MIFENENEMKIIKNCLSVLQSATLPAIKGIESFRFSKECEFLYDQTVKYENELKEKKELEESLKNSSENEVEVENIESKNKKIKRV